MNETPARDDSEVNGAVAEKKTYVKPTVETLQVSGTKGKATNTPVEVTINSGS